MHCFSKTHFRDLSASKLPGVLMDKNKTKQNLNEYLRHGSGNLRTMVFRNWITLEKFFKKMFMRLEDLDNVKEEINSREIWWYMIMRERWDGKTSKSLRSLDQSLWRWHRQPFVNWMTEPQWFQLFMTEACGVLSVLLQHKSLQCSVQRRAHWGQRSTFLRAISINLLMKSSKCHHMPCALSAVFSFSHFRHRVQRNFLVSTSLLKARYVFAMQE